MTRFLLALGLLWGMAGCSGGPPSGHPASSSGATTATPRTTAGDAANPRTPPVKPDPG